MMHMDPLFPDSPDFADGRRSTLDVTNQVDTMDPVSVSFEVAQIYERLYRREFPSSLLRVFADIGRLYRGEFPGYHSCETDYHDIQHILEVTLAMSRLMDGCVRTTSPLVMDERLFRLGTVSALFHDIGYLRRLDDNEKKHGAEYTRTHVGRGAEFMSWYLPEVGLEELADPAARIVHFTGYEVPVGNIQIEPQYRMVGNLLGSADILAQMADRCYLEKCHDRLYPEFVLGGIARRKMPDGTIKVVYKSGKDLLSKTPAFYVNAMKRLDDKLHKAYHYAETHFGGENLYIVEMEKNAAHATEAITAYGRSRLRRAPPSTLPDLVIR